ncbi:MAG: tRNA (adenosine(37)-N6)-threonylcarbamoyltransferase complex ATPase subunit type 1 TsaE [Saprospiraceae bacterium]|nr:tRNA (adenosine(37)-N6)-threonylcarbamoyltransferase complex ATPase subunit type 1 TsaE [Saprospiraceae bacterium]
MTTVTTTHVKDLRELESFAKEFASKYLLNPRTLVFYGEVGAGKTTFIKLLCTELGVTEATSSPSFSIINEYLSKRGKVFHIDLYRLNTEEDVWNLGLEELFFDNSYCLIEWPELVEAYLPDDTLEIYIEVNEKKERFFKIIVKKLA